MFIYLFYDGGPYHVETSPLICSFIKELNCFSNSLIAERLSHFISGFQYSSAFAEKY